MLNVGVLGKLSCHGDKFMNIQGNKMSEWRKHFNKLTPIACLEFPK